MNAACMNEMTSSAQLRLAQLMISSSADASMRALATPAHWSEDYARDSSPALVVSLIRHFLLLCQLLLLPQLLFPLPYSVSSLLPPEALIRNEVEGGRNKNNRTERISGV